MVTRSSSKRLMAQVAAKPAAKKTKKAPSTASESLSTEDQQQVPWYHTFTKGDPEYSRYMAEEWGFEKRGDKALFEKLSLEGAQSGLSWLTILRKRSAYRLAFFDFDVDKVAAMTDDDIERLLASESTDPREIVVRHRGKLSSVVENARCIQAMRKEQGSDSDEQVLDTFLWSFVGNQPIVNCWERGTPPVTKSEESVRMSKALKQKGFRFVGPTTCYAFMQSVGMVIDHPVDSPEWKEAYERCQKRPGGYQERT